MASLADNNVLVAGGGPDLGHVVNSAEIYDPKTGRFTMVSAMSVPRRKASATAMLDGRVLITGGADQRDFRAPLASAEIFDPKTASFHPTGGMSSSRYKHGNAAVLLGSGSILIAGGGRGSELFDPAAGSFRSVPGASDSVRYYSTATLLPDGGVLVLGGYGEDAGVSDMRGRVFGPAIGRLTPSEISAMFSARR
jgi:hypothetical protein